MKNASPRRTSAVLLLAALTSLGLAAPALATTPADLLYERALMRAADTRCGLFAPGVGAALGAAAVQARGAALRAGQSSAALDDVERRARAKALQTACGAADLKTAAARVTSAFQSYARQTRETYAGDTSQWTADRTAPGWRLAQGVSLGANRLMFGLTAAGDLAASAGAVDGRTPYTMRLVVRDAARTSGPYLDRSRTGADGKLPYPARTAPASLSRTFLASSRAPADPGLLAPGVTGGWRFGFPAAAADALARLDPREAVILELVFSTGGAETVRTAYVEVGDFAAGRAFLQIAAR